MRIITICNSCQLRKIITRDINAKKPTFDRLSPGNYKYINMDTKLRHTIKYEKFNEIPILFSFEWATYAIFFGVTLHVLNLALSISAADVE